MVDILTIGETKSLLDTDLIDIDQSSVPVSFDKYEYLLFKAGQALNKVRIYIDNVGEKRVVVMHRNANAKTVESCKRYFTKKLGSQNMDWVLKQFDELIERDNKGTSNGKR
jgi:hypothetical protein